MNEHATRKTGKMPILRLDEECIEGVQEDHDHGAEEVEEVQVMQ